MLFWKYYFGDDDRTRWPCSVLMQKIEIERQEMIDTFVFCALVNSREAKRTSWQITIQSPILEETTRCIGKLLFLA